MAAIDEQVREILRAVDHAQLPEPELEVEVLSGVRRQRRRARAAWSVSVVCAVASVGVGAALNDRRSDAPVAADPSGTVVAGGSYDCTGMEMRASGVASGSDRWGAREIVLLIENGGATGSSCIVDSHFVVSVSTVASSAREAEADYAGDAIQLAAHGSDATLVTLTWRNWCVTGPVRLTASFGDGTLIEQTLNAGGGRPPCSDPATPAALKIERFDNRAAVVEADQ